MLGLLKPIIERFGRATDVCFKVTLADGTSVQNRPGDADLHFRFKTAGAQWRAALMGHVGLLEAYFDQTLDVEGNLALAFRIGMQSGIDRAPNRLVYVRNQWHEFRSSNATIEQARVNARFHYGLG